jgi:uncharacterized cupin superfamily protein
MSSQTGRRVVNATSIEVETASGNPSGFQTRYAEFAPLLGSELLGATVYEFDPGERTGPYHYEVANEECLLVLAGTPTLRHPEGRDVLDVGDLVMFPEGPDGAHELINESSEVARVLILSTMRVPFGCVYPDSGKVSTFAGVFPTGATVDYWEGESAD